MQAMKEKQLISEAMRALGRRTSDAKKLAATRNSQHTQFKAKPLDELACTCGHCPDNPKTTCPRGRAIRRRMAASAVTPTPTTASVRGKYAHLRDRGFNSTAVRRERQREVESEESQS